jgi:glutamate racemase
MKIFFDNGTPRPIARSLTGHQVTHARRSGWHQLANGELIQTVEAAGYDVFLTTDENIRYQQNLRDRKIALVVLGNQQWPLVKLYLDRIVAVVEASVPGSYAEVDIPFPGLDQIPTYPPR